MNVRRIFWVFLAVLCTLGISFATAPAQADAAADPVKSRFITYNVCGGVCPIYQNDPAAWRDTLVKAIDNWNADVVMLQEVCYDQWTTLRSALQDRTTGAQYDSIWTATLSDVGNCKKWKKDSAGTAIGDTRFGLVTLVKGDSNQTINNSERTVFPLVNRAGSEDRVLLCGQATVSGKPLRICNTHIGYETPNVTDQARQVALMVNGYVADGEAVVLGGDFNPPKPNTAWPEPVRHSYNLSYLYRHNQGTGVFQEVDETDTAYFTTSCAGQPVCRTGENTADTCSTQNPDFVPIKLDYIFVSPAFKDPSGDAATCTTGMSDHRLLRGEATWAS
ncbi:endonuclease/exonuclease/phosphatase family protein [Streptomyces sp. NPDC058052]|uniref:endonuclease/exonuclease/phosphatase family protein n=1 Tax=Streptomyces sp. NPDC058052 TaxID=3346316 RepID=UPI0036ED338A